MKSPRTVPAAGILLLGLLVFGAPAGAEVPPPVEAPPAPPVTAPAPILGPEDAPGSRPLEKGTTGGSTEAPPGPPALPPQGVDPDLWAALGPRDQASGQALQQEIQDHEATRARLRDELAAVAARCLDCEKQEAADRSRVKRAQDQVDQARASADQARRRAGEARAKVDSLAADLAAAEKKYELARQGLEAVRPLLDLKGRLSADQQERWDRAVSYWNEAEARIQRLKREKARAEAEAKSLEAEAGLASDEAARALEQAKRASGDSARRAQACQKLAARKAQVEQELAQEDKALQALRDRWSTLEHKAGLLLDARRNLARTSKAEAGARANLDYWVGAFNEANQAFLEVKADYDRRGQVLAGMSKILTTIQWTAPAKANLTGALMIGTSTIHLVKDMFLPDVETLPRTPDGFYDTERIPAVLHLHAFAEAANRLKEANDRLAEAQQEYLTARGRTAVHRDDVHRLQAQSR